MAQIQDSPKKKQPPKSSPGCFLGCFGFSHSPQKKVKEDSGEKIRHHRRLSILNNSVSWFSRSQKSSKKSFPVVDSTTHDHEKLLETKESFRMAKLSKKFSTNHLPGKVPADGSLPLSQIPAAVGADETVNGRENKARDENNKKKIHMENNKNLDHSISITNEQGVTLKKGVFKRSWSQTTMSDNKREVNRQAATAAVLSHSASLPPASTSKFRVPDGGAGDASSQESQGKKNGTGADKFDQLVGMSIIVVTLLIMIIWGKLCAILCTSAWLYFYPMFRATKNDHPQQKHMGKNGAKSLDLDIESKNLKKKVVFEGFLERTHR